MDNLIEHIGLDKHEAKIYKTLLEMGTSTVTEITKKAGITRTLGYVVLEKLAEQGLVNRASGQGKKIHYAAQHPRRLAQYVENRRNQWERRLKDIEHVLPDLVSIYKIVDKPIIRFQEGLEGAKSIYQESLETKDTIFSIADIEGWDVPELAEMSKNVMMEETEEAEKLRQRVSREFDFEYIVHSPNRDGQNAGQIF